MLRNLIERSNNDIFKARTHQVPSYKLKHLDWREKQTKISNEQIRIHIRSSKLKTYKLKRNRISQFNKNITSKVYINNLRQIKPSLVPKSSLYQDVLLNCSEWSINVTSTLFVLLSSKQYISSSLKASYSSSTVGLELGSLKIGVLSEALISSLDWQAASLVLSVDLFIWASSSITVQTVTIQNKGTSLQVFVPSLSPLGSLNEIPGAS